jgi:hypothetical protein
MLLPPGGMGTAVDTFTKDGQVFGLRVLGIVGRNGRITSDIPTDPSVGAPLRVWNGDQEARGQRCRVTDGLFSMLDEDWSKVAG